MLKKRYVDYVCLVSLMVFSTRIGQKRNKAADYRPGDPGKIEGYFFCHNSN